MKHIIRHLCVLSLLLFGMAMSAPVARAQTGGGYDLTWNSIDNGGATFSTGGSYQLGGTFGQLDAGDMSGGAYTLRGGFWNSGMVSYNVYLPVVLK